MPNPFKERNQAFAKFECKSALRLHVAAMPSEDPGFLSANAPPQERQLIFRVGEIVVAGPHVGLGFFRVANQSRRDFGDRAVVRRAIDLEALHRRQPIRG